MFFLTHTVYVQCTCTVQCTYKCTVCTYTYIHCTIVADRNELNVHVQNLMYMYMYAVEAVHVCTMYMYMYIFRRPIHMYNLQCSYRYT